jgi:hypothetical protein
MKNRAWFLCAVLCLLTPAALLAQQTVTATGTAAILNKDMAQARDRAVESALRSAVERVVGTMVDSESLVKNNDLIADKIFTQTRGYISDYKILSEKPDMDSNIYSVSVEATVKEGNLSDDLNSLGLLLRRMKMPRVAVALDEDGDTASANVLRMLKDKGFLVVDAGERASDRNFWTMSMPQQADLMKRYGAEVVILGSAKGEQGGSVARGSNLRSFQASVSLKAVKTDTHEVMGTASGSGTAVHLGEAGLAQALKQASTVAGNDIIRQITKQWESEATSTRILTLVVRGMGAEEAEQVAHRLQTEGRGIQDVMVRESSAGESTLNVSMQGDASALAQEVVKLYPKLRVVSKSANSLTVSR